MEMVFHKFVCDEKNVGLPGLDFFSLIMDSFTPPAEFGFLLATPLLKWKWIFTICWR
jgi:hypothetical protein